MTAPYGRQTIHRGQQRIGVLGDVTDGEIVGVESPAQAAEGDRDEQELRLCRGSGQSDPGGVAALGADERQNAQREGGQQGQDESEVADFRDHGFRVFCAFCAWSTASLASGGM